MGFFCFGVFVSGEDCFVAFFSGKVFGEVSDDGVGFFSFFWVTPNRSSEHCAVIFVVSVNGYIPVAH